MIHKGIKRKEVSELKRIAICDDEIGTCSDPEKMILDFAACRALQIETEVFYSGESFYRGVSGQCPFDLCFLDIQLLEMDGVQVGRQIREQFIRLSEANKIEFYFHVESPSTGCIWTRFSILPAAQEV